MLKKTDLKGFEAERQTTDPSDAEGDASLYECVGAKIPTYLAENPGFAFTKSDLEIGCWASQFRTAFEAEGIAIDKASVKLVKVEVAGADSALAYEYDIAGSLAGSPVGLRGFAVNALVGQTELSGQLGQLRRRCPSSARQ